MKNFRRLVNFLRERHSIYLARQAGASKPWTEDPILQRYRFCNVYRELDTVTRWVREHVREQYENRSTLWFMLCVARHFNHVPTLQYLMRHNAWPMTDGWSPGYAADLLQNYAALGNQVYTGAYMINPPTRAELAALPARWRSKPGWSCQVVLGKLWEDRRQLRADFEDAATLERAHRLLLPYRGWGGFMAYEVVSDLRWTRYLRGAKDVNTWAHLGPGALRGLQRVYGRPVKHRRPQDLALREAWLLLRELWAHWPRSPKWPTLELREVEHGLCEFDKYERVRLGEGRPRSTYNGLA